MRQRDGDRPCFQNPEVKGQPGGRIRGTETDVIPGASPLRASPAATWLDWLFNYRWLISVPPSLIAG